MWIWEICDGLSRALPRPEVVVVDAVRHSCHLLCHPPFHHPLSSCTHLVSSIHSVHRYHHHLHARYKPKRASMYQCYCCCCWWWILWVPWYTWQPHLPHQPHHHALATTRPEAKPNSPYHPNNQRQERRLHPPSQLDPKTYLYTHQHQKLSEYANRREFQRNCRRQLFVPHKQSYVVQQLSAHLPRNPAGLRNLYIVPHDGFAVPSMSARPDFFFFFFFKSRPTYIVLSIAPRTTTFGCLLVGWVVLVGGVGGWFVGWFGGWFGGWVWFWCGILSPSHQALFQHSRW